jgi:hypothetical protein
MSVLMYNFGLLGLGFKQVRRKSSNKQAQQKQEGAAGGFCSELVTMLMVSGALLVQHWQGWQ